MKTYSLYEYDLANKIMDFCDENNIDYDWWNVSDCIFGHDDHAELGFEENSEAWELLLIEFGPELLQVA